MDEPLLRNIDQVEKYMEEEVDTFVGIIPNIRRSRYLTKLDLMMSLRQVISLSEAQMDASTVAEYIFNSLSEMDDEMRHVYWARMSAIILCPTDTFMIDTLTSLDRLIKSKYRHRPVESFTLTLQLIINSEGYDLDTMRSILRDWDFNI